MKTGYIIAIIVLLFATLVFVPCIFLIPSLGKNPSLENAIQFLVVIAALFASIIALSTTDKKKKKVIVKKIESFVDKEKGSKYHYKELSDNLKEVYKKFPKSFKSYMVQFKLINISGFTLEKPTLTFRLPLEKQHPAQQNEGIYEKRNFNSNLFNSQKEINILEFEDTRILSNSNLPYWDDNIDMIIWFRMVLYEKMEPFVVKVSVNCENAEGVTEEVEINPKELLK